MFFIIGQFLTLVSYLVFWFSRFKKHKHSILLWDNISRIIAIIAFLFLGTYDGIKNTFYVMLRNYFGQITNRKSRLCKIVAFCLMLLLLVVMYCFYFQGISTIAIALCGVFNLYGVIMCNEQGIRLFGMIGSVFYTLFMIMTNNIIGIICEIICFFIILVSYLKFKNQKRCSHEK